MMMTDENGKPPRRERTNEYWRAVEAQERHNPELPNRGGNRYSALDRVIEALSLQTETVAAQAETIRRLSRDAQRGRAAYDAMMQVAIKLGINPVPTDALELSNAILAAFGAAPTERQEL